MTAGSRAGATQPSRARVRVGSLIRPSTAERRRRPRDNGWQRHLLWIVTARPPPQKWSRAPCHGPGSVRAWRGAGAAPCWRPDDTHLPRLRLAGCSSQAHHAGVRRPRLARSTGRWYASRAAVGAPPRRLDLFEQPASLFSILLARIERPRFPALAVVPALPQSFPPGRCLRAMSMSRAESPTTAVAALWRR